MKDSRFLKEMKETDAPKRASLARSKRTKRSQKLDEQDSPSVIGNMDQEKISTMDYGGLRYLWQRMDTVNEGARNLVGAILDTGKLIIQIRDRLTPQQFDKMFSHGYIRIGRQTADQLIAIASNSVMSEPRNHTKLPVCMASLYLLSRIPAGDVQHALDKGFITPRSDLTACQLLADCVAHDSTESRTDRVRLGTALRAHQAQRDG